MGEPHDDVLSVIRHVIATKVDFAGGPIELKHDLVRDLHLDSVSRTLVLVALEDHYQISLEGDAVSGVRTVEQLVAVVNAIVSSR